MDLVNHRFNATFGLSRWEFPYGLLLWSLVLTLLSIEKTGDGPKKPYFFKRFPFLTNRPGH